MGYSEAYCQLCGVSFNIVFGANSGPLDPDDREYTTFPSQTPFVKTTDVSCFTDFEETDDDTEYTPQEIEDSDPYEYDSDISTDVSSNEDTPEDEESIDTTDTESQQYTEWVKKTFNPNCRDPEEHVGYYDASDSTYSINIISPEEARGCRTAQFLHHKNSVWQPDELHEPWEVNGDWALSGICDGMPSRDCDIPTVWPARGGVEQLEADNSSYHPHLQPDDIAMPLHPWCFDIFCRQSQIHSKEVDASGLMNWRNSELDSREFYQFPRTEDVKIARGQWWSHDLGSEYLVANPLYVPGLSELLLSAVNGEIKSEQHAQCEKVQLSQFTKTQPTSSQHQRVDFFSSIPLEIRLMIVGYLGSDDITSLRAASRTFTTLPNNVWYRLIREEMPWLWEAWDESECKHTPQIWTTVSTAQVKSILKSRERLSEVLRLEYMTHEDSEKVAENWFPIPCDIPEQVHLPRLATDWHFVFVQINKDWNRLKGLRNRQRIWIDVEEIMRRIQNLK